MTHCENLVARYGKTRSEKLHAVLVGNAIFSERVVCVWLRFCGRCSLSGIMQTATMATWQETSTPGRAELLTGWLWYSLDEMNRTQRQQKGNDTGRVGRMGLPVSCTGARRSLFTGGRAAGCNQKKGRENGKKTKIDSDHTALDKPPRRVCSAKLNTPDFFHLLWQAAAHMARELKIKTMRIYYHT